MDLHIAAATWLLRHTSNQPRHAIIEACTKHLVHTYSATPSEASSAALQAYAERESTNTRAWIDTDASTSHFVVIRRPGQKPLALTVRDLLRRIATQPATPTTH